MQGTGNKAKHVRERTKETIRKLKMNRSINHQASPHPASSIPHPRAAFTLVERLVVITIIGVLVALITTAAIGALKRGRETQIKSEINQLDVAFNETKNKTTALPPNCQTDGTSGPIEETTVFNDLKRYLSTAFPRHRESDDLIRVLVGINPQNTANFPMPPNPLPGGMSAAEAIPFWTGTFSSDPKFPISGEGGPAYAIQSIGNAQNASLDPIASRTWAFDKTRLGPRDDDKYFNASEGRFIEYQVTINGQAQFRRINFWKYYPNKSDQPYVYFDVSRYEPEARYDPAAAADLHVHAFKKKADSGSAGTPIQFMNAGGFQIFHCGDDGEWGEEEFERMSAHDIASNDPNDYLLYPTGPFVGDIADTITNIGTQTKVEDAAP
jgi:prepilin-type N-terminal cleavage/methylation domain-containing protein